MSEFDWNYVILDRPDSEKGNVLDWAMALEEAETDLEDSNMYGAIYKIVSKQVQDTPIETWEFVKEVYPPLAR